MIHEQHKVNQFLKENPDYANASIWMEQQLGQFLNTTEKTIFVAGVVSALMANVSNMTTAIEQLQKEVRELRGQKHE